jgi:non-heme chloroperoxidase
MKYAIAGLICALSLLLAGGRSAMAASALEVLGRDYTFRSKVEGFPEKLSDFRGLQINTFATSDGVRLSYWEAGEGKPLVFVPGWSANGAEYINVMYLLSKQYHVYVLDQRNQGLSQRVDFGTRIPRYSMDLKEFADHLGLQSADYCGWSMGASVIWGYIDLFGTKGIRKAIFVDEPISIASRAGWSEQERRDAGSIAGSPDDVVSRMATPFPAQPDPDSTDLAARFKLRDSPYFANSEAFAEAFIHNDMQFMLLVMFDHAAHDWRDVLRHKIDIPVAFFTGEWSMNVPSQRWAQSVVPNSKLYVYTKAEQGDHFLMFKNPSKFTSDLRSFLEQ